MSTGRKIGEMNGYWALLLKLHLAAVPPIVAALVGLVVWLVSQQYTDIAFRSSEERFSTADAYAMENRIRERETVLQTTLLARIEQVDRRLDDVERNLARVLVILEQKSGEGNR